MKKKLTVLVVAVLAMVACVAPHDEKKEKVSMSSITKDFVDATAKELYAKYPQSNKELLDRGVACAARFWTSADGTADEFKAFCLNNFVASPAEKHKLFVTIQRNFESMYGRYNQISVDLKMPLHVVGDPITRIDEIFGGYDPFAHFSDDMFASKVAFITLLNFPQYTLAEKNTLGKKWSRTEWAYARLADWFVQRVPASVAQNYSDKLTAADNYISNYNIMMGCLRNDAGEQLFADGMALITHWGLRDELKSNYANADGRGLEKQRMIYQVMQRIIDQSIPQEVISNDKYTWNPFTNVVKDVDGKEVKVAGEPDIRYATMLENFVASSAMDPYCPAYPTVISRAFDQQMEVSADDIEAMFVKFISSPEVKQVAALIEKRLGRKLEPFDIWYDGFKSRSAVSEDDLSRLTRTLYPNTAAVKAGLPQIMLKLGFTPEKAAAVCAKVEVDASRGAGHAWGAMSKNDVSRLRTRVAADGMDYKGYNIAVHEFGHNVEQTITMNDVDNYVMSGIPSTAFTEALAFVFQKRDLELLGYKNTNPHAHAYTMLDIFWGCYEIMGVSLVDIYTWRWLYENPNATPAELKATIMKNAREVWNKYYAPVLGEENSTILGIYSHMIDYPLYLPNYPFGHIVESQLETHLVGRVLGEEVCRIYPVGRLTPNLWMQHAVGSDVSVDPLLRQVDKALGVVKK